MPSPFSGMDPYIEASGAWSVFHYSFIGECSRYLNEQLPENYVATVGDRVELVSEDARWQDWHQCDVYAWSIRAPLPTIPVPLRIEDGAIGLDLAAVFARTYDNGRFERVVRYGSPVTALPEADRIWAAQQVTRPPS